MRRAPSNGVIVTSVSVTACAWSRFHDGPATAPQRRATTTTTRESRIRWSEVMLWATLFSGAPMLLLVALSMGTIGPRLAAQETGQQVVVSVLDERDVPVTGLTVQDFRLRVEGTQRDVVRVEPASDAMQVAVLFEGLAATPQQTSAAVATLTELLGSGSEVDVMTVRDDLEAAISDAADDLAARAAPRPIIILLGQVQTLRRPLLSTPQVRARGVAGDFRGDVDLVARELSESGTMFFGVSVTEGTLDSLQQLARMTGGRFELIPTAADLADRVSGIARDLSHQYVLSYEPVASRSDRLQDVELVVAREGLDVRWALRPRRRDR